jgi:hypothetical protein
VTVTATARDGGTATAHASGRRQAHATAVVTTHVARRLRDDAPPGVHHIHQAIDVDTAMADIESAGITIGRPGR